MMVSAAPVARLDSWELEACLVLLEGRGGTDGLDPTPLHRPKSTPGKAVRSTAQVLFEGLAKTLSKYAPMLCSCQQSTALLPPFCHKLILSQPQVVSLRCQASKMPVSMDFL